MKKGEANMHFNADDSLVKMMMDLVSSSNDFCIVFGTTKYGFGLFLLQKSRRTSLSLYLDFLQLKNVSSCAPIPERNLSVWRIQSLLLLPNQQTRETVVERANEKKDEELVL